jgi:hypothetical protein
LRWIKAREAQIGEFPAMKEEGAQRARMREALPMNLFHLNARAEHPEERRSKTWLVVARSAGEAMALVPAGLVVVSVEVHSPCKPGPARLVGWMGPPPPLPAAVKRPAGS